MTIQVTGTLVDPVGQPLTNATIRVTALETTTVVARATAKIQVGITGTYDFNLVEGKHQIEVLQTNKYHKIAYVEVTGVSPSPTTIEALIATEGYCKVEAKTCAV